MTVLRVVALLLALIGVVLGAVAVATTWMDIPSLLVVGPASFAPILLAGTAVGAVIALVARRWLVAALSVVLVVLGSIPFVPLYVAGAREAAPVADGPGVRVLQTNIMLGLADASDVVATVRDRDIDVMTVQELTDDAIGALDAAGLVELLPYRFTAAYTGGAGAGIYSRFPLTGGRELDGFLLANVVADIDIGAAEPVRVFGVHPIPPYPTPTRVWGAELARLSAEADAAAVDHPGAVVVSGDFNSTYAHSRFRSLIGDSYVDAADSTGAGIVPSYPTDKSYPPVVGIDHVLVRGGQATSLDAIDVAGSDHRALIVDIAFER